MKKKGILAASVILLIALIIYSQKIYFPIEGTVIDAETGKPIEGAVVLAEWTITKGIGLTATEPYMIIETFTDKNGKFKINAYVLNPFVNEPDLIIYKAGFVCWSNNFIFPNFHERKNSTWETNKKYALEKFKREYSHAEHISFMNHFIPPLTKTAFEDAYDWEVILRQKELEKRNE